MAELPGNTVKNFARGPAWVYYRVPPSKHMGREADDPNPAYYDSEKKAFHDPEVHKQYRKGIIARTNKAFRLVRISNGQHCPERPPETNIVCMYV